MGDSPLREREDDLDHFALLLVFDRFVDLAEVVFRDHAVEGKLTSKVEVNGPWDEDLWYAIAFDHAHHGLSLHQHLEHVRFDGVLILGNTEESELAKGSESVQPRFAVLNAT
jgi:hypothetical protein